MLIGCKEVSIMECFVIFEGKYVKINYEVFVCYRVFDYVVI